jgi:hypothetical protein
MDYKKINNKQHHIYDNIEEFKAFRPKDFVKGDWREGNEGDWVFTDDGYILQILKKSDISHPAYKAPRTYVRTLCGSYIVEQNSHKILGEKGIAENIYTFSGNYDSKKDYQSNRKLKSREFIFASHVAMDVLNGKGQNIVRNFKKAFPGAKSDKYIKEKSSTLINKDKIQIMIKEETQKILEKTGVSPTYIIERFKRISDMADNDTHVLKALDSLAKISGLFETDTKKEQVSIWSGFTPEQIEGVKSDKGAKILAQAEKGDKTS